MVCEMLIPDLVPLGDSSLDYSVVFFGELLMYSKFTYHQKTTLDTLLYHVQKNQSEEIKYPHYNSSFIVEIIKRRIDMMELPISFTDAALIAISIITQSVPGKAILILIECLTKYENQIVNLEKLFALYPSGFYDNVQLRLIIDTELKTGKRKWSEIY